MKSQIKIERTTKGKVKKITITPTTNGGIEDLIDSIIYESQKDEPTTPLRDIIKELDLKHNLNR